MELKSIIEKLNNRLKSSWIELTLAVVISIMGIWQAGFSEKNNPYWTYMKLPVLVFYGVVLVRFIVTNRKLNENINNVEKHSS